MPRLRLHFADLQVPIDYEGDINLEHPFKDKGEFAVLEGYMRTILFRPEHLRCIEWMNEDIVDDELAREADRRFAEEGDEEGIPLEQVLAESGLGRPCRSDEAPGKD